VWNSWNYQQRVLKPECGERHSRSTQRSSSVVSPTAHTALTPSSASIQDSQHCRSLFNKVWLESVTKLRPSLKHSSGHVTSSHTIANRWNQVNTAGKLSRLGSDAVGCVSAAAVCSLYVHRYNQWLVRRGMHTYANMQINDMTGHYNKNNAVSKLRWEAYHHNWNGHG